MILPGEKTQEKRTLKTGVSRRNMLKIIASATTASILNIFPEVGGVKKASATPLYNCSSGGIGYCCDVVVHWISCMDNGCYDVYEVKYSVDCGAIFGCRSCTGACRGPYYDCSVFCAAPGPACWMCPL